MGTRGNRVKTRDIKAGRLTAGHFAEVDELRVSAKSVAGGKVGMLVALV